VKEIFWRQVTDADFVCVERSTAHGPKGGGGQTYFSISFGSDLDKAEFGRFLGLDPPAQIELQRPDVAIEAAVLTDPAISERLEFKPRYQSGPDERYRIANQNRQRRGQSRHPAWRSARGFPEAPDDVAYRDDPRMPDLSLLKLIVARDGDGTYLADYVNADRPPADAPAALNVLFTPNREVAADGLIDLEGGLDDEQLRAIIRGSHERPHGALPTSPEIEDARDATARAAGARGRRGQGFRQSAAERTAIDRYAMQRATDHLEAAGWKVEDRSINHPYDLFCSRPGDDALHIEVKGTTSDGAAVLLTPNEVQHARDAFPATALLVVHGVRLANGDDGEPVAGGGEVDLVSPWDIDSQGTLHATGFSYERL
jgi:Domain of unknown function (DUF3883)